MGMITAHSGNLTYTRKKAIGDPSIDAHCSAGLSPTQRHVACSVLPSALFDTVFQGVKGKTHAFKFVLSSEWAKAQMFYLKRFVALISLHLKRCSKILEKQSHVNAESPNKAWPFARPRLMLATIDRRGKFGTDTTEPELLLLPMMDGGETWIVRKICLRAVLQYCTRTVTHNTL